MQPERPTFQACIPVCERLPAPPAPLHQGSHRFHNFASGLRSAASDKHVYEAGGESWPLGLVADDEKTSPTLTLTS